jgi:hypothetical protein
VGGPPSEVVLAPSEVVQEPVEVVRQAVIHLGFGWDVGVVVRRLVVALDGDVLGEGRRLDVGSGRPVGRSG